MKRLIDDQLTQWKDGRHRKPLILRGARQVGKTWSLRRFGEQCFDSVVLVDLERNSDWHHIFDKNLQSRRICGELEIVTGRKIVPGKTLLFFDEIQACPRAVTALRYFYEEMPDLHVVAAGSLLEFTLKDISIPVGRVKFLHMHPLCFAEYLQGIGREDAAAIILNQPSCLSDTIHNFLCDHLRNYFFIGGMPECVTAYAESGSFQESFEVQAGICDTYRMDFAKYTPRTDRYCLDAVFTAASRSVGKQIKYAGLAEGYTNPTLKKAFELLRFANLIKKIPSTDPSGLPLGAGVSGKVFKALILDVGLMRYLTKMPVDVEYSKSNLLTMYQGALAEQFVGQEMLLSQNQDLYYWARRAKSSSAEVDYLAVCKGGIYPVEVKSGAAGRLKSLHLFLKKYLHSPYGIVFSDRPYAELPEHKLKFIPLYFAYAATGGSKEHLT